MARPLEAATAAMAASFSGSSATGFFSSSGEFGMSPRVLRRSCSIPPAKIGIVAQQHARVFASLARGARRL